MTAASPDRIEIDKTRMVDGLVELLDELADLAINRVVLHTRGLPGGFNPETIGQAAIDRFKCYWFAALGELMFQGMARQTKIAEVRKLFRDELDTIARGRRIPDVSVSARAAIDEAIAANAEFAKDGLFAAPREAGSARYRGLGADLAAAIVAASFSDNVSIAPIRDRIAATVEAEFVNAYAQCARACAKFEII